MNNPIYPERDLEDNYIENQSIWEEVLAGGMGIVSAMEYMQIDPDDPLWDKIMAHFITGTTPL